MGTRKGLRACNARLMEPVMKIEVVTPEDFMGDIIGDINARRGMITELGERSGMKQIEAKVPLASMFQYVSTLRSMSRGRAQYTMTFDSYELVPPNVEKEITSKFKAKADEEESEVTDSVSTLPFALLIGFVAGSGLVLKLLTVRKSTLHDDDFRAFLIMLHIKCFVLAWHCGFFIF